MEPFHLDNDIRLCCVSAKSFPDGVMAAFQQLMNIFPDQQGKRRLFGISWPDGHGGMVYKAAVNETYTGEAEALGLETYLLKKGEYLSLLVHNFMSDIPSIGKAFGQLVEAPGVHPYTVGVEEYINTADVRCMVPMFAETAPSNN
ncbi:transcriptional regulator [Puia dinghuensis]|uniref:Uncharacterized protein n=1 Tax=Puia dinghuensis TaxID=1792502 RepID=A0A8J2UHB2_9BACT|nr:transcriptional regulator [Puia dinghuensis]GGB17667.1 hypothetical protein GCM10011511_46840 [Puia dinghuensis]